MKSPKIGFAIALCFGSSATFGATYYISPSGNNSNDGSKASPFQTIQYVGNIAQAGDTFIVEQGVYDGVIFGWDGPNQGPYSLIAGTAGHPITFEADPNAPAGSVIIKSGNNKNHAGFDLEPGCDYIQIIGFNLNNSDRDMTRAGIKATGNFDVIKNNTVSYVNCTGTPTDHVQAGAQDAGGEGFGIIVDGSNGSVIQGNTVTLTCGGNMKGHGLYLSGSSSNCVVNGNDFHENGFCGFHINGDVSEGLPGVVTSSLIENNLIYNNGMNGFNADGLQNSVIENNLIFGNDRNAITLYQMDAYGGSKNNVIINNTLIAPQYGIQISACMYDNQGSAPTPADCLTSTADTSTGNIAFNNIILGSRAPTQNMDSNDNASGPALSSDLSLSNNVTSDSGNLFINAAANNYGLAQGSPAISAGVSSLNGYLAPSTDLAGSARPTSGGGYDAGAYQFGSQTSSLTPVPGNGTVPTGGDPSGNFSGNSESGSSAGAAPSVGSGGGCSLQMSGTSSGGAFVWLFISLGFVFLLRRRLELN